MKTLLFLCIVFAVSSASKEVQNQPTFMQFDPVHQLMFVRYKNPTTNSKSSVSMYTFGNRVSSAGAIFDASASTQFAETYPYPAATAPPKAAYLPPELDLTKIPSEEENEIPEVDETPEKDIPVLVDDEEQEDEEPVVIVQNDEKTVGEEEDEEEISEEVEVPKKKPSKGGALFPVYFGKNRGATIAIANSYSTGKGGSSKSVATAFGHQRDGASKKVKC
jgi:hypothetical protein